MSEKEFHELKKRVSALEETIALLQKQIATMPQTIMQQMARAASRRL